jgi:hypothetical protein
MDTLRGILAETPEDTKGVRLDLEIVFSDNTAAWVDVAVVHPTAKTYLSNTLTWVKNQQRDRAVQERGAKANNPANCDPSPAFTKAVKAKLKRYSTMVAIDNQQLKSRKRLTVPTLVAAVATHHGEFAPDLIRLVELITREAGKNFKMGHDT